jgi:hypothetical protein
MLFVLLTFLNEYTLLCSKPPYVTSDLVTNPCVSNNFWLFIFVQSARIDVNPCAFASSIVYCSSWLARPRASDAIEKI